MSRSIRSTFLCAPVVLTMGAQAQTLLWANQLGLSGDSRISVVHTDDQDNVYVLGEMMNSGSVDLDPGPGTSILTWSFGDLPGGGRFVAKYDSNGALQWGWKTDRTTAIAVSPSGMLVILYGVQDEEDEVDMDPGPGTAWAHGPGVGRYSTNGEYISSFSLLGANVRHCEVGDGGEVLLFGSFLGTTDLDPGGPEHVVTSNGHYDLFLAKYDATDALLWARTIGGPGMEYTSDLRADGTDHLLTFRTVGAVPVEQFDVDPGPAEVWTGYLQNQAATVLRLNSDGEYIRHMDLELPVEWRSPLVRPMADGGLVLSGGFSGYGSFQTGGAPLAHVTSGSDAFIHRVVGESWQPSWVDLFSAYGNEIIFGTEPFQDETILVCGMFTHSIDVDPGPGTQTYADEPPGGAWVAAYCLRTGARIWSSEVNGTDRDMLLGMHWCPSGAFMLIGQVSANANIGLTGAPVLADVPTGTSSAFIGRYRDVGASCQQAASGVDELHEDPLFVEINGGTWLVNGFEGPWRLRVLDMAGRPLVDRTVSGRRTQISMGERPSGMYLVERSGVQGRAVQRVSFGQ